MRRTMYSDGLWDTAPRTTDADVSSQLGGPAEDGTASSSPSVSSCGSSCTSDLGGGPATPRASAAAGVVDTAYTNMALLPHTDCTYYSDPPALQIFNCAQVMGQAQPPF
jgi:alpha-ketoglutarate-dependent taurine dioxygenase